MDPDLFRAVAELLWPLMAGVILWRLYPLAKEVAQARAFTVKVGDMEISVQDASDQLQTQVEDLQRKVADLRGAAAPAEFPSPSRETSRGRLLWVDDVPSNNAYSIAQLKDTGFEVLQAVSTTDAIRVLGQASGSIKVVVSDMGRTEGGAYTPEAGLELLRAMRASGYAQPFIVCTTRGAARHYHPIVQREGGSGATTSHVEILEFVRAATAAS